MIFYAINEDKPFVDKKNKIKNIFCGKNTFKVHFMTTSNILQAMLDQHIWYLSIQTKSFQTWKSMMKTGTL